MLIALHLRDIRRLNKLNYHVIVTLNDDRNRELLDMDEFQNVVVSKNIVKIFLTQLALNSQLKPLFIDILSKVGIDIDIINISEDIRELGEIDIGTLRKTLFINKYIYIGHVDKNNGKVSIDLDTEKRLILDKNMALLVIN